MKKIINIIKASPIPSVLAIISLILFIPLYYFVTATAVEPYYFTGLIYLIPFISFAFIAYYSYKEKIKKTPAIITSLLLIIVLGFLMGITFFIMAFDAALTETTKNSKYERVLSYQNILKMN